MIKLGCAALVVLSLAATALFYAAIRQLRGRDE
jgi:hypothetical protein